MNESRESDAVAGHVAMLREMLANEYAVDESAGMGGFTLERAALTAAIAAMQAQQGAEPVAWQPIESAPKNQAVLVFACGQQFVAWLVDDATSEWHEEGDEESDFNGSWVVTDNKLGPFALRGGRPTHWQPLPTAPADGAPAHDEVVP